MAPAGDMVGGCVDLGLMRVSRLLLVTLRDIPADAEIISHRTDENGVEICCGIWSTAAERSTLSWARGFIGDAEPALVRKVA